MNGKSHIPEEMSYVQKGNMFFVIEMIIVFMNFIS